MNDHHQKQEEDSVASVRRLLQHVEEQLEKRQYLNAADAAAEMTRRLLSAYSAVTKQV